jgi:beta-barrel assembly-enhancing protease
MDYGTPPPEYRRRPSARLWIALLIAAVSILGYLGRTAINPVTGQKQRVALTTQQEIAMGLQSAPEMARQFGGLDPDDRKQALAKRVGQRIVSEIPKAADTYPFDFHVLADPATVNAFALPGGQVFITAALFDRLQTEGQLAGVLGHEIGHVIERHSAEQMAQAQLTQGLSGAVVVGTYDPNRPGSQASAAAAAMAAQMINLRYGRGDETEADSDGVRFMAKAGYDPRSMIKVMEILKQASGGRSAPEWLSSHPDPGNRMEHIQAVIAQEFPGGLPPGLRE